MAALSTTESATLPVTLKITNKDYILHFVPNRLYDVLTTNNKIVHKIQNRKGILIEKKLKTSKIMELINMIICTHYMKAKEDKSPEISLSTKILRENYGTNYNFYLNYLKSTGILKLLKLHSQGNHSRIYELNMDIFEEGLTRYENSENFVIQNWINKRLSQLVCTGTSTTPITFNGKPVLSPNTIPPMVKKSLIDDLFHVELDFDSAYSELISMKENKELSSLKFYKNLMSISAINSGQLFFTEDKYGRFHTNFTTLKTCIRSKHLKIDGLETAELDIVNSQPMFLSLLLKDNGFDVKHPDEYAYFKDIVMNGEIYELFMKTAKEINSSSNITRKEAKTMLYIVMFGGNRMKHGTEEEKMANKTFKKMFPYTWQWIRDYKKNNNNHKLVAWELQNRESKLIFGEICYAIKKQFPGIRLFTVHDSIYYPVKYKSIVENIFYKKLNLIFN
jgi:hypothetical protein